MFTFKEVHSAYKLCRLRKRPSVDQIRFESNLVENLSSLLNDLNSGRYKVSSYTCFIVNHPKPREIFAAHFRDRIVHHLIVSRLEGRWEKKFFYGSFACRKGKGTHGAMKYLVEKHKEVSQNRKKKIFFLQMDVASFFVTVNREILFNLLSQNMERGSFHELIKKVILHDPTENVYLKSGKELRHLIPEHKSLFCRDEGQGIPIGNLTSQFGANIYLTELDHFISRHLKVGGYLRYMDDLLLIDESEEKLLAAIRPIEEWLRKKRKQEINPDKTIIGAFREVSMDYLGHKFIEKNGELLIFPQSSKRYKLVCSSKKLYSNFAPIKTDHHLMLKRKGPKNYIKSLASFRAHLGNLKHSKSYFFRKRVIEKLNDDLFEKAQFLGMKRDKIKIR